MATVAPESILKQLAELWVTMGKQGAEESGQGVLRACTMTLVVLAEESEDVSSLGETLAALMPEHPARAIVIRLRTHGEHTLSERVYAQCWMPFGQRRQICCEQVEIIASDDAVADLPSVVLPLAVPDLPLILWCRSARVGLCVLDSLGGASYVPGGLMALSGRECQAFIITKFSINARRATSGNEGHHGETQIPSSARSRGRQTH